MASNTLRCPYCGLEQPLTYEICSNPVCQRPRPPQPIPTPTPTPVYYPPNPIATRPVGAEKKLAAGLCGILLGGLGIHKFILGYTKEGVIMLVATVALTLLSCGVLYLVPLIFGIIEGIIYLTKSDEDFVRTYIENKRGWF